MREWKEIGGIVITPSGPNLLMRFVVYDRSGSGWEGADVLLSPDEMFELYKELQGLLKKGIDSKLCRYCKNSMYGECYSKDKEVNKYECIKEHGKYFEPRFQL
jgi:hypothetical protein